jgi:hypothetical protein
MSKRQPRFAALASAIEMAAIVGAIWTWVSAATPELVPAKVPTAIVATIASLAVLVLSFFLRRHGHAIDRRYERQWLNGRAVVDPDVLKALEQEKMPVSIVRAVRQVGNQPTLRGFRLQLKKQCGPELSSDQLATILQYARASR